MQRLTSRKFAAAMAATVSLMMAMGPARAQTEITPADNKYDPAEDVEIGKEAAEQVEEQLPLLRDRAVNSLVQDIGASLVDSIPPEFRHDEFDYSFKVVNVRELNAFALPGGPTYINRGMIEAARTEGELAGVLAHELSHVALRHGTAQATKATPYQIGAIAGAVLGAIIGGNAGAVVSQGTQFGLGTAFLRYGRQFEREADLLGAQIMARAGYDPRDMADMFETLERENGGGVPEFLSSHPNPGNRREAIEREAEELEVSSSGDDYTVEFERIQDRLDEMDPAPRTADVIKERNN
jgi:predicted Zn-dependent protease